MSSDITRNLEQIIELYDRIQRKAENESKWKDRRGQIQISFLKFLDVQRQNILNFSV